MPDTELVERAQSGSLDAFEQLVNRHQQRLFRFLLARCACRADAEDALQEAFAAAWRYLDSYRPQWAFSTWLYRIAWRHAGRLAARKPPSVDPLTVAANPTQDQALNSQRRVQVWELAKDRLSDGQSTALWLYYAEDLSIAEIARAMGRPQTWIKVNLFRARQRLARELDRDEWLGDEPMIAPGTLGELE